MHDKSRENLETLKLPQLPLMDEVTEAPSGKASHLLDISNPPEVFFISGYRLICGRRPGVVIKEKRPRTVVLSHSRECEVAVGSL